MKKYSIVFAVVALLSIFATALPASAQADVVKTNFTFVSDMVFPAIDLCDGEFDLIRRESEFTTIEVTDGQGRTHRNQKSRGTFTYQNPTTGEIRVASSKSNVNVNPNNRSFLITGKIVIPGPGNNYFVTTKIKTVTNANGEVVVDSFESTPECR